MKSEVVVAYCTFPDEATADRICEVLVAEGTIACANIFPPHRAIYRWKNQLMRESEVGAFLKTTVRKTTALKERIRAIHPYETPGLVFLKVEDGLPAYLQWVRTQSL